MSNFKSIIKTVARKDCEISIINKQIKQYRWWNQKLYTKEKEKDMKNTRERRSSVYK